MNERASNTLQLRIVSFTAAGHRFAIDAASVRAQRPATETDTAMPAEELLGLPVTCAAPAKAQRILIIRHATGDLPVRVSEPVTLSELNLDDLHLLPDMLAARCKINGLCALSTDSDRLTALIDFNFILKKALVHEA
jgi:hypothetical protein